MEWQPLGRSPSGSAHLHSRPLGKNGWRLGLAGRLLEIESFYIGRKAVSDETAFLFKRMIAEISQTITSSALSYLYSNLLS
jgi:hypothetical protein